MRILLTRLDRIGDLMLSTPAIATVRRSFPGAHVALACSAYNRVAVERNDDLDELIDPSAVSRNDFAATFQRFDLAIGLSPRRDDVALVAATRAARRVGYTYERRWLSRLWQKAVLTDSMISEADPGLSARDPKRRVRHEVDQLLDLVAIAGARDRVETLRLDISDEDRQAISYLPRDPIVVHLGMRWFRDGGTLDSTLELIRELARFGRALVVTYAPECERFVDSLSQSRVADVLLGGLPFYRWAAVVERAAVVVTVDTGATHVASAARRPTVVAFEHRYFELSSQEWAPYRVPSVLVRKPADSKPASLERFRAEIVAGVSQLLNA